MVTSSWHHLSFRTSQSACTATTSCHKQDAGMREGHLNNCSLSHSLFDKKHKFRKYAYDLKRKGHFKPFSLFYLFLNHPLVSFNSKKMESLQGEDQEVSFAPSSIPCPLQHALLCVPKSFCYFQQRVLQQKPTHLPSP